MPKELTPYQLAEQKIADALRSGATELNLSNMRLSELPESLGELTHLQRLTLHHNNLTLLPESLAKLTQLQYLNLSKNLLKILPTWFCTFTQLQELDLYGGFLRELPDIIQHIPQLRKLEISSNQLKSLPSWLGNMTQLQVLYLSYNTLEVLPDSLGQLTQLTELNLSYNQLTALPDSLGQLTQLTKLDIANNKLKSLPNSLGQLAQLQTLHISNNQLTALPETLGQLLQLQKTSFGNNNLAILPKSLGQLTQLNSLRVYDNLVTDLPSSLAQLKQLEELDLSDNPLNPALQSAYNACSYKNYEPLWAYLRSIEQNAEPLYEAKLVLVGEGNVGKTTLLKALKNEKGAGAPKKNERTTHGVEIDIHGIKLPHPDKDGIEIQLNAWDFGGQDVYRVTHQFFFSRRSLYLLVWEPRRGVQQGQVEDWLNMIRLRVGDEARVLIVSTHCKTGERIARIDQPVLQQQYGAMIVGFYEVDSLVLDETTGEMVGIAELKKVIARESAKLEQMGMMFNNDWKAARDELLARDEPRISYSTFSGICAARGLSNIATDTLAHLMHDLGYIVHYSDDEKLRDDVVLKPEWLTKAIGFVLEDRKTQETDGILEDNRLFEVWHDHTFTNEPKYNPEIYPFFLRLMEKYDVSYRLTDGNASLVAQHVPQVRPELPWLPEQEPPKDQRRIAMVCALEEDPPGLVPWMIVRTHDYAYPVNAHSLHWQKGMFLSHGTHGTAMLEKRDRDFYIYAQAAWPEHFMNVIHSTLEKLIADNWPGMKDRYRFMVPCPETVDGQPCKGRFNITGLRKSLTEGDIHVRCQECSCKLSIAELLLGFEERTVDIQLREIKEQLTGLDSRVANYFMAMMNAIADEAKNGPRLFTLRSRETGFSLKPLLSRPLEIQLWCEAEGCQHRVIESGKGIYPIDMPHEWLVKISPYANFALRVLSTVTPVVGPAINSFFGRDMTKTMDIDRQLELANAIIGKLPKIETSIEKSLSYGMLSQPEHSGILALHRFLNEVDPTHEKLGLHRVATYTGDYRWLCKRHYDAYQPNIPDVIN
ncbi:MAG: leucine-rich repeat domain-containing protein [Anaerolineales bacterium]|nr:leucine-rich repeat domain-containing protein [Anaerolineales bacterium]